MKVVIPLAGLGKRMRPHTHSKAKPMVRLAGKPILGHLLDWVITQQVEEVILIISPNQLDVEDYARSATSTPVRIVVQDEPRGQADAIARVRPYVVGPMLVLFSDTLADETFEHLADVSSDGLIYVKEILDPSRFGVIIERDGRITDIVEKPRDAASRLATIGMYYFRTSGALFEAIERVMAGPPTLGDEYFIADAIKLMIGEGRVLEPRVVSVWEDTGTPECTLHAHRFMLERLGSRHRERPSVVIIPPVYIADDAEVAESVIGPYVSIESGCRVERSVLADCILDEDSVVQDRVLARSLLGRGTRCVGSAEAVNLGDDSTVEATPADPLPSL